MLTIQLNKQLTLPMTMLAANLMLGTTNLVWTKFSIQNVAVFAVCEVLLCCHLFAQEFFQPSLEKALAHTLHEGIAKNNSEFAVRSVENAVLQCSSINADRGVQQVMPYAEVTEVSCFAWAGRTTNSA